jgi:hypothetical protein
MRAFFKSDSSDWSDRWRRRNGRILWRLIVALPVLVSLYLLGFLSAAMVSSVGHPSESITLLRSTVRHLFQPNESALEPPQAFRARSARSRPTFTVHCRRLISSPTPPSTAC